MFYCCVVLPKGTAQLVTNQPLLQKKALAAQHIALIQQKQQQVQQQRLQQQKQLLQQQQRLQQQGQTQQQGVQQQQPQQQQQQQQQQQTTQQQVTVTATQLAGMIAGIVFKNVTWYDFFKVHLFIVSLYRISFSWQIGFENYEIRRDD